MMIGVNIAGGEFGERGSVYGRDYIYPNNLEIDYYASRGMDVIRVPFQWERVQPSLNGALSANDVNHLVAVVDYANSKGITVALDAHDYGMRTIDGVHYEIGLTSNVPSSTLADFWGKMAEIFKGKKVMYGIMNEPFKQSATDWLPVVNDAIHAIRDAGATEKILVSGTYFDGAHSWVASDNDTVIGEGIADPLENYAFEVHQYFDSDNSGTSSTAVSSTIGSERLKAITEWARAKGKDLFLGEFAAANNPTSLAALDDMLNYMDNNADVWIGATHWAAGSWWGDYMFSIQPVDLQTKGINATDKPQIDILEKYDLKPNVVSLPSLPQVGTPEKDSPGSKATTPTQDSTPHIIADLTFTALNKGDAYGDIYISTENLRGGSYADSLYGNTAANVIKGEGGNDKLYGGEGNDTLYGGSGSDWLYGQAGKDTLYGGGGSDRFVFTSTSHSRGSSYDTIKDFTRGSDRIDLRSIDAKTKVSGDQAFKFIGSSAFTGKSGQLHFTGGFVSGDVNGDKIADFRIKVAGLSVLTKGDFYL